MLMNTIVHAFIWVIEFVTCKIQANTSEETHTHTHTMANENLIFPNIAIVKFHIEKKS